MSNTINNQITQEGFDKLTRELEHLKSFGKADVALKIQKAIDYGDLSENSEYDAAKEEQAMLEQKISSIENSLKNVKIVKVVNDNLISIGKTITLLDINNDETFKINLVGNNECDIDKLNITISSPIGRKILGLTVDDTFEIDSPDGNLKYQIQKISII